MEMQYYIAREPVVQGGACVVHPTLSILSVCVALGLFFAAAHFLQLSAKIIVLTHGSLHINDLYVERSSSSACLCWPCDRGGLDLNAAAETVYCCESQMSRPGVNVD